MRFPTHWDMITSGCGLFFAQLRMVNPTVFTLWQEAKMSPPYRIYRILRKESFPKLIFRNSNWRWLNLFPNQFMVVSASTLPTSTHPIFWLCWPDHPFSLFSQSSASWQPRVSPSSHLWRLFEATHPPSQPRALEDPASPCQSRPCTWQLWHRSLGELTCHQNVVPNVYKCQMGCVVCGGMQMKTWSDAPILWCRAKVISYHQGRIKPSDLVLFTNSNTRSARSSTKLKLPRARPARVSVSRKANKPKSKS